MIKVKRIDYETHADFEVILSAEQPLVVGECKFDVPFSQFLCLSLPTHVKLPDGQSQLAQFYNIESNCLLGTTSKLAPIFNGNLEPVPFEYDPDQLYFKYMPGSWLETIVLEGTGWNEIQKFLMTVINPEVNRDNVRAALNNRIPDQKITVRWKDGKLEVKADENEVGLLGLIQLAVQGELRLTASISKGR